MSDASDSVSVAPPFWGGIWAAGVAGAVVSVVGIVARLALLHDVSPLEDAILRSLLERGVSLVLLPNWTEPLVGLIEVAGFAALGGVIGTVAAALQWSATRALLLTVVIGALAQILVGCLPRVPL